MEFCGIKFAPLNIPLERRLQTLSAAITFHLFALGPLFATFFTFYMIVYTRFWWLVLCYLAFFYYDIDICNKGGRPSIFVQTWSLWRYFAAYTSIKTHRFGNKDFDSKKNYLICSYPHGVLPTGIILAMCGKGLETSTFQKLFPHHQCRVCALNVLFYFPFYREFVLSIGLIGCSAKGINYLLSKQEGGYLVGLMPGGAQEAFYCIPGQHKIILKKRKGFVKMAIKTGTSLVPAYTFGETDLLTQIQNKYVVGLLKKVKNILGIAPIIPIGRGFFQYSFGFIQFRVPLNVVVGDPIDVVKNENPTNEEVNEVHEKFMQALVNLFEEQKHLYIKNSKNVHLEIVE